MLKEAARIAVELATVVAGQLIAEKRHVEGLIVLLFLDTSDEWEAAVRAVARAMDLIEAHDGLSLSRVRPHLKRIVIMEAGFIEYRPTIKAVALPTEVVLKASGIELALAIVHETAHARLWQSGFRPHQWDQERVERLCLNRERAFARRLPDPLEEQALQMTKSKLEQRWWEPRSQTRQAREELAKLNGRRSASKSEARDRSDK